ncbi:MAG: LytR family transcriptional regulator [Cyanobacteria bacterium SIG29]|nr:LytR family transcriptional regulator [Cyanobacteria bacterium SIG29]
MAELKDKEEQYNVFLKYKEKSEEDTSKMIITLRVIFISFFVVLLTMFVMFIIDNSSNISAIFESFTDKNLSGVKITEKKPDLSPSKFNFKMLSRYQNIMVLGVDSNGPNTLPFSGVRSDTILILNVDIHGKTVNAISIPRDSKVYLADEHGVQKINAAYALGGVELTRKTIEETLGIKIHNYVIVNAQGVRKLIDAIGGVPIYVEQDMFYRDYSGKLFINLHKGKNVLTGEEAEGYLRYRKDYLGDIGRVHRQQKFIKALIEKVKSPEALRKIPEALKIASLYTRTDLNLYQMSQYAAIAREIDLNKVEFVMLPGGPNKKGITSYWILDPEKTQQVINRLIYRKKSDVAKKDISVGVMYTTSREVDALNVKEQIKNLGYDFNCIGRSTNIYQSEIVGYNTDISTDLIKSLQKEIEEIHNLHYVHNPVRNYCSDSDFVITLADEE